MSAEVVLDLHASVDKREQDPSALDASERHYGSISPSLPNRGANEPKDSSTEFHLVKYVYRSGLYAAKGRLVGLCCTAPC
jgi:hypothetical protein